MSNDVNTELLERAASMIDYWEGTAIAKVIEQDIDRNDLEELAFNVSRAEAQASQQEFEVRDAL